MSPGLKCHNPNDKIFTFVENIDTEGGDMTAITVNYILLP